ncbi:HEXXH motif domain-containing protein [Nonomuraea sp. PA05]|uniref:HEXXH motif domain-containing protein n=1 Tax=Nonomuraea sp. PA05 TaxID=2604466 RepID=UPI0011D8CDEE|nr:HEXXH motif domain-containing protein [Nonomuraea sp. PA05]TYB57221.1 HEXXH motif domain-containing protein [Nonomuraea sp. PA05]
MPSRDHRLPDHALSGLASGGGGADAVRHLVAPQRSKRRLLLLGTVRMAAMTGHPHARATEHAYDVLAGIEKKSPAAVRGTLAHPAVGAWAASVVRSLRESGPRPDGPHGPARLGAVAAVAAIKAGVPCEVQIPVSGGAIMLPSLGQIQLRDDGADGLVDLAVHADGRVEAGNVCLRPGAVPQRGWLPLRRLETADAGLRLLVDDLDFFRWSNADTVEGRLRETEFQAWRVALDAAWKMLRAHHWTIAAEIQALISVLTPIKGPAQGMTSASAADRFGTIAMSTPPDGRWLASTFAHEVQHNKLNAILDVVALLKPDEGSTDYAPWRPDPRPLPGLLQGAYAFLGVAGFWRRQRAHEADLRPHAEFARWREAAHLVTGTLLDSGRLTAPGERFAAAMRRTLAAWLAEPVPPAALESARREAEAHRATWQAAHGRDPVTGCTSRSPS